MQQVGAGSRVWDERHPKRISCRGVSGKLVGANNTVLISDFQHGVDKIMFNTIADVLYNAGWARWTICSPMICTANTISPFVFASPPVIPPAMDQRKTDLWLACRIFWLAFGMA